MKQVKNTAKKLQKHARPLAAKIARIIIKTPLPEIAFVATFIFGHYLLNADFQYPSEMIIPIVFFAVLASVIFWLYRLVLHGWLAARLASLPLLYALYSYSYLPGWLHNLGKTLLPAHFETAFSNATLAVIVLALAAGGFGFGVAYLVKRVSFIRNLQPHRVVLFVVLFIFTIQLVKVVNRLVVIHRQLSYSYPAPNYSRSASAAVTKPDIYYFVFDRYGNTPALQKNFAFDSSPLTNFLSGQGFVNHPDAQSNYPFTMSSISSTLAMNYHTDLGKLFGNDKYQTAFPYRSILSNPPVAQVLKQNGYTYNQVSSWWDFTRVGIAADNHPTESFRLRAFGKNFYLSDLTRDIVNKSIMSPWLKKGVTLGHTMLLKYDNDDNPRQNFYNQEAAVKTIASTQGAAPQFTFAHFLAPHDPYIFDADGSDPAYDGGRNDYGVDETVKYTKEITYLNTQIEDMMSYIRAHSPNAVIVIQSDEGPYPKQFRFTLTPGHYYDPADLPLDQEKQKFGVLASYYMPGVDAATVSQNITSSVDPFRFVLQHYLGYDMPKLPNCQLSTGDKFTLYKYSNQTPKLQTNPAAACASL